MKWGDIGKRLARLGLPTLGGAVAGPAGAAVGARIAKQLGLSDAAEPGDVLAVLEKADLPPEALVELERIEADREAKLAGLEVQDRQDARANRGDDRMRMVLATFLVPAPMLIAALMVLGKVNLSALDQTTIALIIGYLIGEAKAATAFYFGTSLGSKKRAEELARERK